MLGGDPLLSPAQRIRSFSTRATELVRVKSKPEVVEAATEGASPLPRRAKTTDDVLPGDAAFLNRLYDSTSGFGRESDDDTPPRSLEAVGGGPLGGGMQPAETPSPVASSTELTAQSESPGPYGGSALSSTMTSAASFADSYALRSTMSRAAEGKLEMLWQTPHDFLAFEEFATVNLKAMRNHFGVSPNLCVLFADHQQKEWSLSTGKILLVVR